MADKMAEYTIAQGHKADYTEDHNAETSASSAEQSDSGLKDILAKGSEDGANVDTGDASLPSGEGADDKNIPDERDAAAYNAWIARQAKEK